MMSEGVPLPESPLDRIEEWEGAQHGKILGNNLASRVSTKLWSRKIPREFSVAGAVWYKHRHEVSTERQRLSQTLWALADEGEEMDFISL